MKQSRKKIFACMVALLVSLVLILTGCSGSGNSDPVPEGSGETTPAAADQSDTKDAPQIAGLTFTGVTPLQYAQRFTIYNYEDGYAVLEIDEGGTFLVVPEGKDVPTGLDEDIVVLQKPLNKIYLAATSAMSLFDAMDALGNIRMSGTQASGWYVDNAVAAMEAGDIIYAGKYSAPDYETMIKEGCNLAIESTMIFHTPKVKEMIEDLGIPVLVDSSSYEEHTLGRTEWIKLYAVLVDKVDEADAFFNEQAKVIDDLKDFPNTGKTVVYFYVNSDGSIVIRNPKDYIAKMIDTAGGVYSFADLKTDQTSSSIQITMEQFFATASEADFMIYNAAIDTPISSISELLSKDEMFSEFKAVKEGNVFTTGKSFYQATDVAAQMIMDMHIMITGGDLSQMTFLTKVE
ncbi:MAG: ABC transporter substrate-binding protein [Lachnospiraceae bacterium]|nr:ABC transporter substrate-binding protein [Lachnospiraceae bacterium]